MLNQIVHIPDLSSEFVFQTSKSSGPGGQNVNKVNSRVELRFDIENSKLLREGIKRRLRPKLENKLSQEGILIVVSQKERSQLLNKEETIRKFYALLQKALKPEIKRKATKPTRASKEKRLQQKKIQGEKKSSRGKSTFN